MMDAQPVQERDDRLRAIICDDDPMARRMVRDALEVEGIVVIAEAPGGREAVELTRHYHPDVVITDMLMPGMDGLGTTREILRRTPDVSVLVLTVSDDPEVGLAALRAGARGLVSKDVQPKALSDQVRRVARGEAALSDGLMVHLIELVRSLPEGGLGLRPVRSDLTSREWEVLDALCAGATVDDIAQEFVLSSETIRSHIKSVLRKLGVHSQREAVASATRLRSSLGGLPGPA